MADGSKLVQSTIVETGSISSLCREVTKWVNKWMQNFLDK